MIQRIQTLYLLLAAAMFFALFFLPIAVIQSGDTLYSFQIDGLQTTTSPSELIYPAWALLALAAIIVLLSLFIIFMYKKRVLQIRMCVYNTLLMIGFCILAGLYFWILSDSPRLPDMKIHLRLWAAFPIIAIIFNYLAIRNIGADEALIRSLNRLR